MNKLLYTVLPLILLIASNCAIGQPAAIPGMAPVTTEGGCRVYLSEREAQVAPGSEVKYIWSGDCIGGLTQGKGILSKKTKISGNDKLWVEEREQFFTSGYAVGYGKLIVKNEYVGVINAIIYSYGGSTISFHNSGLRVDEASLFLKTIKIPDEDKSTFAIPGGIVVFDTSYSHFSMTCALYANDSPEFKNCNWGTPESNYDVPALIIAPAKIDIKNPGEKKKTFCPNPKVFDAACADLFFIRTASARKEVISFISTSKSSIETILQRIDAGDKL